MWPNRWRVNDPFVAFETDWFCLPRKNIAGSWSFFLTIRSDLWTRNHWTQDEWFQFLLTLHPEKIHFEPKVIQVDGSDVFPFQKRVIFRFKPNLVPVWGFVLFDGSKWLSPKQHWTQFEMSGCLTRYPTKTVDLWFFCNFGPFLTDHVCCFSKLVLIKLYKHIFAFFRTFVSAFSPFLCCFGTSICRAAEHFKEGCSKEGGFHPWQQDFSLDVFKLVAFMCKASGFP